MKEQEETSHSKLPNLAARNLGIVCLVLGIVSYGAISRNIELKSSVKIQAHTIKQLEAEVEDSKRDLKDLRNENALMELRQSLITYRELIERMEKAQKLKLIPTKDGPSV